MTYQNDIELDPETTNNILPENLTFIAKKKRKEFLAATGPKIVIASGGMGSHGAAKVWIASRISRKDAMIHFTCYLADGTLGKKLFDTVEEDVVEYGGEKLVKKAEICFTSEFSAHAKGDQLISFLKLFKKLKFVVVTHGISETKEFFATLIRKEIKGCSSATIHSMVFHRINSKGLVKSQKSKLKCA
ncbi:Beta-Casp domain protein [compost metagenome]